MLSICYPPGARGDFLASILLDTIGHEDRYKDYAVHPGEPYQKIHWIKDFLSIPAGEYHRPAIRIRLNTLDDYLTVLRLWQKKIPNNTQFEYIIVNLMENELRARTADHMFDRIINFSCLFDITAIQQIYRDMHGRDLDADTVSKIKHNISLQQQCKISLIDCGPIGP